MKGDKSSHNLYPPGFPGYSDLNSNVDCFDSIDKAKDAGYHIPVRAAKRTEIGAVEAGLSC